MINMATALMSNLQTEELAEIEDIEKTIEKAKGICKKLENRKDEKSKKVKTVLKEIIEKLDIAMCESIILEETQTSVPSFEQKEVEQIVVHQVVKVKSSEKLSCVIPDKMNYKQSIEIRQKDS